MVAVRETKPHQIPKPQGTLEKLKTKIIERKSIRSGKSQIIERKKANITRPPEPTAYRQP